MNNVTIYTDGGCRGNGKENNIGGYGIVMMVNTSNGLYKKEFKKGTTNTTNNIMELSAVVDALSKLKYRCEVELYTDSKYVCDAINKGWINNWIKKGWITSTKKPVANKELWQQLSPLLSKHSVKFIWVKGHADNEHNNQCDLLANQAMDDIVQEVC